MTEDLEEKLGICGLVRDCEECYEKRVFTEADVEISDYSWHNIRTNPNDFPQNDVKVLVTYLLYGGKRAVQLAAYTDCLKKVDPYDFYGCECKSGFYATSHLGYFTLDDVIGWKYIEPMPE